MHFSIRREVGFATYEQDLQGLAGAPIELALPHKLDEYLKGSGNLGALAAFVRQAGISCPSVHAPPGQDHGRRLSLLGTRDRPVC